MDTNENFEDEKDDHRKSDALQKAMVADLNGKIRQAGELALKLHRMRSVATVHPTAESMRDMSTLVVVPNHMKYDWDRPINHCEAPRHEEKVLYRHPQDDGSTPVAVSGRRVFMNPLGDDHVHTPASMPDSVSSVHAVETAGVKTYTMMGQVLAKQPPKPLPAMEGDRVVAWQGGFAVMRATGQVEASGRGSASIAAALACEPPVTAVAATRDSLFCGHADGSTSQHHPKAIRHNGVVKVRAESVVADTSIPSRVDRCSSKFATPVRSLYPFSCGLVSLHEGARARCIGYEYGDLPSDDHDRSPISKMPLLHRINRKLSWMGGVDQIEAEELDGTSLVLGHKNHTTVIHFDPYSRSWDAEMSTIQLPVRSEIIWHPYNSTELHNHHIAIAPRSVHIFCLKNPEELTRRKGRATVRSEYLDRLRAVPLSWWSSYIIRGVTYPSGVAANRDIGHASLLIPKGLSHLDDLVTLSQI